MIQKLVASFLKNMNKYQVDLIDANSMLVTSQTVKANSFEDALRSVVPKGAYYNPLYSSDPKLQSYEGLKYNARVTLVA
jgi:hypothetical protein